jgi:intraflagellar transport protein 172
VCCQGGLPAKAANVIKARNMFNDTSLLERVATSLTSAGLHDRAGELYEEMGQLQRGLDAYIKGHAYRQAVELARRHFPSQVVELQESWGDWLVSQKQVDMAINHFIEANASTKAIEAALSARQWQKAAQFAENLDLEAARPYYKRIARHYEQCKQMDEAEKYFIAAQAPKLAVEMFTKAALWDRAHKLATTYMSEREVSMLYISQVCELYLLLCCASSRFVFYMYSIRFVCLVHSMFKIGPENGSIREVERSRTALCQSE